MERKGVRIVKLDWLEDSLTVRTRRVLNTIPYEFGSKRQTTLRGLIKRKREACVQGSGAHGCRIRLIVLEIIYLCRYSLRY